MHAYLLTRGWRDKPDGLEITLWATTEHGPVCVVVSGQRAVCFIDRDAAADLPHGTQRTQRELCSLQNTPVDALYFLQQRQLTQFKQSDVQSLQHLYESDVKPHDRYLMERFIQSGFSIEGNYEQRSGYRLYRNPKLRPINVMPALRVVSLDIETRAHTDTLYSIGADVRDFDGDKQSSHPGVVFMVADNISADTASVVRDGYTLHFVPDEQTLLTRFIGWLKQHDPDVIAGWAVVNFDLNFLQRVHQRLNVPFDYGRGEELAAVLAPAAPGQPKIARLPGRAVLDGIDLLKAGFWSFESFSLDNVSQQLLGQRKLITSDEDKVAEINRLYATNKPALADYNFRDCALVNDIFAKANLIGFACERANLTGLALDRLGGSVAALDNLYLPRLHRRGFVARDVGYANDGLASPGGYVLDSQPGLYRNVLVLDFKSLYPSIIRTFKIDPLGLHQPGDNPIPGYLDAEFSRNNHILPALIEELWQARDRAKAQSNAALSQAIKIIMNSFYGVLGSSGCRFHSAQLASSITRRGHDIITQSQALIESFGYPVIYGDTDSLFVHLSDKHTHTTANAIGRRLMTDLNQWWQTHLQEEFGITSSLEVEYETHYSRFFMPTVRGMPTGSKKRYAGLVTDADGKTTLVVKGLEAARTDWTPLARDFQRELFQRVFHDQSIEGFVQDTAFALARGELDEQLVYTKRLRRRVDDYLKNVPPHVQAARKLPRQDSHISYVITVNGPEPIGLNDSPLDYDHYIDKQLAPAADGILQFLDTSFAQITDAQMQMF